MSKGSTPRPPQVRPSQVRANWDRIFKEANRPKPAQEAGVKK